jgi:hypothetical protein
MGYLDPRTLPFRPRKLWHWRWLQVVASRSSVLHRLVTRTAWDREGDSGIVGASGLAACGIAGAFGMPGIFSRMGAKRCPACCDAVGVPRGSGAPFNGDVREPGCQGPRRERKGQPR